MAIARAKWRDAFEAQMDLWKWERSPLGLEWINEHYQMNSAGLHQSTRDLIHSLYRAEIPKLETADPIYISEEMCELVDAAKELFKPEPLFRTDLLVDSGFLYYAKSFPVLDRFQTPTSIAAVSWSPVMASKPGAEGDFPRIDNAIVQWREKADAAKPWGSNTKDSSDRVAQGIAITLYAETKTELPIWRARGIHVIPKIVPMHLTPWWFGMEFEGNEVDENGKPTGAFWWWRIVQSTLRLMQQKIAVRHEERPERPERREAARLKFPESKVLVVRLRRERSKPHDHTIEPANYSHRFIVGGHWRNQWFPASAVHRQIWISPYVKGPKDKPLVVKPRRAFTWDR